MPLDMFTYHHVARQSQTDHKIKNALLLSLSPSPNWPLALSRFRISAEHHSSYPHQTWLPLQTWPRYRTSSPPSLPTRGAVLHASDQLLIYHRIYIVSRSQDRQNLEVPSPRADSHTERKKPRSQKPPPHPALRTFPIRQCLPLPPSRLKKANTRIAGEEEEKTEWQQIGRVGRRETRERKKQPRDLEKPHTTHLGVLRVGRIVGVLRVLRNLHGVEQLFILHKVRVDIFGWPAVLALCPDVRQHG